MFKPLDSYSRSNFELINKNNKVYLKKNFNNFNKRDFFSLKKQSEFKNYKIKNTHVIAPLVTNDQLKKVFINKSAIMDYYEGISGTKILIEGDNETFNYLSLFLRDYIKRNLDSIKWSYIDSNILINKVELTLKKTKIKELTIIGNKILSILKKRLGKSMMWSSGYCHGDLTLGNIIFNKKEKKIILIDFLKTYNEGFVQDLSNLTQEFYLGWSARNLKGVNKLRAHIIYEKIWKDTNFFNFNNKTKNIIFNETLVTLLRIFPYISKNDIITIKWIQGSFDKMINKKFVFFN